jgi:hypothetical protein
MRILFLSLAIAGQFFAPYQVMAQNGAFGIKMGQLISSVPGAKLYKKFVYEVGRVPNGHPEFESYMIYTDKAGRICKVSGLGKTYQNDSYGTQAVSAFERLHDALGKKYGSAQDFDFLKAGSIWDEPRDYHMSIEKSERVRASYWSKDHGSVMPIDIGIIGLTIKSVSSGLYISIGYEFSNFEKCSADREEGDSSGL